MTNIMLCLLLFSLLQNPSDKPLSPAEAIKQIGKPHLVVELTVKKAKDRLEKRGIIFLDSEEDFKDPSNLCIAISADAALQFKQKGIADPATHFLGKRIRVKGNVMRFEERPYLPVLDPAQISVADTK